MPTDKLNLDFLPKHVTHLLEQEKKTELQALLAQFRSEDVAEVLLELDYAEIRTVLT